MNATSGPPSVRAAAGAVIVRVREGLRTYLLVASAAETREWSLPQGGVELDETPEAAALRAVSELVGVRAAIVSRIRVTAPAIATGTEESSWFLAVEVGSAPKPAPTAAVWLPFQAAQDVLGSAVAKQVLAAAEDQAVTVWPDAAAPDPLYISTLQTQLEFLNARMLETSDTANKFLTRFVFGGMVAVVALLNADLVMFKERPQLSSALSLPIAVGAGALIVLLSFVYFRTVERHYSEHRLSHRKLKYKFELTLYALLAPPSPEAYARSLEHSIDPKKKIVQPPASFGFASMATYMKEHHREQFTSLKDRGSGYTLIAMLLVVITMVVRASGLLLQQPPQDGELKVRILE